MRRGIGIAGLSKAKAQNDKFKEVGQEIAEVQVDQMKQQLETFRSRLEEFATKYKNEIRKNPEFRKHFNEMCVKIGVDPLASNKGFWAQMLGVGDFYYELAVQVSEVCIQTRTLNGGLIDMSDILERIRIKRGSQARQVTADDIIRAVSKLKNLGNGFDLLRIGSRSMLQSVPMEINNDHTTVLLYAQEKGFVTYSQIQRELGWSTDRFRLVLNMMLQEGIAWIDQQADEEQYWIPTLFFGRNLR